MKILSNHNCRKIISLAYCQIVILEYYVFVDMSLFIQVSIFRNPKQSKYVFTVVDTFVTLPELYFANIINFFTGPLIFIVSAQPYI